MLSKVQPKQEERIRETVPVPSPAVTSGLEGLSHPHPEGKISLEQLRFMLKDPGTHFIPPRNLLLPADPSGIPSGTMVEHLMTGERELFDPHSPRRGFGVPVPRESAHTLLKEAERREAVGTGFGDLLYRLTDRIGGLFSRG